MCTPAGRRWWGWSRARGEGIGRFRRITHAKQIAHAPQPAVWSADKERQRLPVSGECGAALFSLMQPARDGN